MSSILRRNIAITGLRTLIGRSICTRSLYSRTNWAGIHSIFTLDENRTQLKPNYITHIQYYSTVAETKSAYLEPRKIPKILKKLTQNTVSLPFNELTSIRQNLFRNYNISVEDGFLILKSCSQLADHSTDVRCKLVDDVWKELMGMVKEPSKSQIIELIQAYRRCGRSSISNYRAFCEQHSISLDSDIFEELMYLTCQNDDSMENALAMFSDMSELNIAATERIYNALILGYSRHSIEQCENVLANMEKAKITPSLATQTELIKAYVRNGNEEKALKLLAQYTEFSSNQLYDIIRCSAAVGHEMTITSALKLLPLPILNAKLIAPELQNICIELLHLKIKSGNDELNPFHLIVRQLPQPVFVNENTGEYGTFLLKEAIAANESASAILQYCDELVSSNRNLRAIHTSCIIALSHQLPIAVDFLKALAEKEPLRAHYFWPLFVRAQNEVETMEFLKLASNLNAPIDVETLIQYVLPKIPQTIDDSQLAFKILQDTGLRKSELKMAMISYLLYMQRPKEALSIAENYLARVDPYILQPTIVKFIKGDKFSGNSHTIALIVKQIATSSNQKLYDFAGQVLVDVSHSRDHLSNFSLTKQLLTEYKNAGVKMSKNSVDLVLAKIFKNRKVLADVTPTAQALIDEKRFPTLDNADQKPRIGNEPTLSDLENHLIEIQANGFSTRGILSRLFMLSVKENKLERALELRKLCDERNVLETAPMLSTTIQLMTATKNVERAIQALNDLVREYPKFKLDSFKVIDLATLLIAENRLAEAKDMIKNFSHSFKSYNNDYIKKNVWTFLTAAGEFGVKNQTEENTAEAMLNFLVELGYCQHSNYLLGPIIKEHLDKKQLPETIEAFERFAKQHMATPQVLTLFSLLIQISNEDNHNDGDDKPMGFSITKTEAVDHLQHLIEISQSIHGAEATNVNLILAFANTGTLQQLRKILMDPSVKFDLKRLQKSLEHMSNQGKINVFVKLARGCRGLMHESLNEQTLYEHLLSNFVRTNAVDAALQLYEEMSKDPEYKISRKFGLALVNLLKKNNLEIPEKLRIY